MIQNCEGLLTEKGKTDLSNNEFFSVHNNLMDIYYDKLLEKQRKKKEMSAESMDEVTMDEETMDKDMSELIECIKAHQTFIGMDTLGLLNNDRPAAGIKIRDPSNEKFDDTFRFDMLRYSGEWGSYYDPDPKTDPNADPMYVNFHPHFLCNKPPPSKSPKLNPIQHLIGLSEKKLDNVVDMEVQSLAPSDYGQKSTVSKNTASVFGELDQHTLLLQYLNRKKPPQQSSSSQPPPLKLPPSVFPPPPPPPSRKEKIDEILNRANELNENPQITQITQEEYDELYNKYDNLITEGGVGGGYLIPIVFQKLKEKIPHENLQRKRSNDEVVKEGKEEKDQKRTKLTIEDRL